MVYVVWPAYKLKVMPGSEPLYAPGKETVGGEELPPPVILIWAHSM